MGRILCRKAWTFVSKRPVKGLRFLGIVLTLALIVSLLPTAVMAEPIPELPHQFYGVVTVSGGGPAPGGLVVSARIDGVEKDTCLTTATGTIGDKPCEGCYGLVAGGTLKVQGEAGDRVHFFVGGVEAEQTWEWESGGYTGLDLTVAWRVFGVPELLSPEDGSCINDNTPELGWTPVIHPSGVTYDLQVDDDDGFAIPVIDVSGHDQSNYTPVTPLPDGTYYWRVQAVSGDEVQSGWTAAWSFQVDTVAPMISDVEALDITTSSAVISWNTDEPATSQVEYGTTSATHGNYGSETPLLDTDEERVWGHGVRLTGLDQGTTYFYRVISQDQLGNERVSAEYTFTTYGDVTPPLISDVTVPDAAITEASAIIWWNTDEPATSQVRYGTEPGIYILTTPLDEFLVMGHAASLSGLQVNTTYYFIVLSKDGATPSNEAESDEYSFKTKADSTPPVISGEAITNITQTSAIIWWNTDEPATSRVEYGTSSADHREYEFLSGLDPTMIMIHAVWLTGLEPGTTYYFRAISQDGATPPNEAWSAVEYSFTTAADTTPPLIWGEDVPEVTITDTSAIAWWNTDELATSQVGYSEVSHDGDTYTSVADVLAAYGSSSPLNLTLVRVHGRVLSGLAPTTTYYYRVLSVDQYDNEAWGEEHSFTTDPDETPPVFPWVTIDNITTSSAVIRWTTNELADTQVVWDTEFHDTAGEYLNESLLNPNPVYWHSVLLVALSAGETYHLRVKSSDIYLNEGVSDDYAFTTEEDLIPPEISGVHEVGVGETSAIIQWLTDEPATTQVAYGTSSQAGPFADIAAVLAAYDDATAENTSLVTSHGVGLAGLDPGVDYFYRVLSKDADGNEAWSDEYSFETIDQTPPAVLGVGAVTVDVFALVYWNTDENATTQVVYSTTSHAGDTYDGVDPAQEARDAYGSWEPEPEDDSYMPSHGVLLSGLDPATTYYYRVISRDEAGNVAVSAEYSFATG